MRSGSAMRLGRHLGCVLLQERQNSIRALPRLHALLVRLRSRLGLSEEPGRSMRRTYRLSQNVRPLIWVECTVEKHSRSRTEYLVKARSQFKERSSASNVEIFLPLPPDAITPTVRASQVPCRTCSP